MKATVLIAAAALACGTVAFAQQQDAASTRGATSASAESIKPADDAQRTKDALKNFGHKTRHAMHRAGDKVRDAAHRDKEHQGEKHARADRHHHHATREMGAPGSDVRDTDASRRQRMDDAYANWKSKQ